MKTTAKREMTRAVTYCRISHDPSGMELGVERQHVDTDRLAAERGWTVIDRVVDNDRSASRYARRAREGWAKLMEMVEAGDVEAVVAYDLDRLIRQPKELERLIDAAERGLSVVTATGVIDLATAGGRMLARTLCTVAAHEADRVSERQRTKLRHDAENGRPHWVRRPFGYALGGAVIEAEAETFREIVGWIVDEGVSSTECARRLNAAAIPQPSGARWQSAGVKFLVESPRNVGKRTYHGEVVGDGTWPPLITEDRWKDAVAALAVRARGRSGRRSMLTGLVRCGKCGETMQRTNTSKLAQFRCTKRTDVGTGCGQSISAIAVEELIAAMVLGRIGDISAAKIETDRGGELETIRAQLAEFAEMVGAGQLSMAEWKALREPLTARLHAAEHADARSNAGAALNRLTGDSSTLAERWNDIDLDLRRRLISLVLDHIEIGPGSRGRLDLGRVSPVWI